MLCVLVAYMSTFAATKKGWATYLAFLFGSGEDASSGSGTPILADAARAQTRGWTHASWSSRVSSSGERGAHAAASFSRSSRLSVWERAEENKPGDARGRRNGELSRDNGTTEPVAVTRQRGSCCT